MKTEASPAAFADSAPTDRHDAITDACTDAIPSNTTTPTKTGAAFDQSNTTDSRLKSEASRRGSLASSCKRRRLASEDDENIGETIPTNGFGSGVRRLNYDKNESDASDDSDDEDPIDQEIAQMRQEIVLKKIKRLNYENAEDQLLHTAAFAKLFEYVEDYDVVAQTSNKAFQSSQEKKSDNSKVAEGAWKYRGSGYMKFIKCYQEGYNCGMIRAELTKNGTVETLMCHELTHEEVAHMPSKKGKAYTWRCKDWAYRNATRTFAIRFEKDMEALQWKLQLEQSKTNNLRVRRGLDIPDTSAVEDVCSNFRNLSTTQLSSPPKASGGK